MLVEPLGQLEHELSAIAPVDAEYLPATQSMQVGNTDGEINEPQAHSLFPKPEVEAHCDVKGCQ